MSVDPAASWKGSEISQPVTAPELTRSASQLPSLLHLPLLLALFLLVLPGPSRRGWSLLPCHSSARFSLFPHCALCIKKTLWKEGFQKVIKYVIVTTGKETSILLTAKTAWKQK